MGRFRIIALIPARGGSVRVSGKNIIPFHGHPLIAYTIQTAIDFGEFSGIYCSSDSEVIGEIAEYYGATWIPRPASASSATSPDREWIQHALMYTTAADYFCILRPTSPFRTAGVVTRAVAQYDQRKWMKAVERVRQHPNKMWRVIDDFMIPYTSSRKEHALPTNTLPTVYVQNGALEIRPCCNIEPNSYQAFVTTGYEGLDINTNDDLMLADLVAAKGLAVLPQIWRKAWSTQSEIAVTG